MSNAWKYRFKQPISKRFSTCISINSQILSTFFNKYQNTYNDLVLFAVAEGLDVI